VTQEDYDTRRRQLEAERRRAIELIEAAHRAQVRALDLVWLGAGGQVPASLPAALEPSALDAEEASAAALPPATAGAAPASPAQPAAVASSAPPVPPAAPRPPASWEVERDLQAALSRLPEVFTTSELLRALGYVPHRGSLHRLLAQLEREGALRTEIRGEGRQASRFRQLSPARTEPGGAE
jgi:hypothetical protein